VNKKRKQPTRLLLTAAVLMALTGASHAGTKIKYQSCSGILTVSEDGEYQLKPDAGSGLWCDAIVSTGEHIGGPDLVPQVLKVCTVNSRCRIKGTYEGRGVFYWNKISEVRR
jgi:hypothetical protein